jgi:cobalt/nickel transport system permease protein
MPVCAAGYAASGAVCAVAVARANRRLGEREVPLLGMTAAFVFAIQMLKYPVMPGASGHVLGATLAAILLGPLNSCLVMTIVLLIQCLVFADGGWTTAGANVFNMGIVAGIGGWACFGALRFMLPRSRKGFLTAAACASWIAVVAASACCAVELSWSGRPVVTWVLVGIHGLIGGALVGPGGAA